MLYTDDSEFEIAILRQITISNYTAHDFILSPDGCVKVISVRDGELFLDVVDLKNASKFNADNLREQDMHQTNYYDSPFKSIDF